MTNQIQETKEILKETAEKVKIKEISTGLLLMAFNLDKLEELNKQKFKEAPLKQKLLILVEALNKQEAEILKQKGYTNECFFNSDGSLTSEQTYNLKEKSKYFYIDKDTSGKFMVDKTTGNFYTIKAYGQKNRIISEDKVLIYVRY